MPNMRVIYDNAADRAALTVSGVSQAMADNLKTDVKTQACRVVANTIHIDAVWTTAEAVQAVILPFTNFTPTASLRIKLYTNANDATPVYDSQATTNTSIVALPNSGVDVNMFSYGGGLYLRHWIPALYNVKKVSIDVTDTALSKIDVGRLVIGKYWAPIDGADSQGSNVTLVDNSKNTRTDAGNILTDIGAKYRKQTLSLPSLDTSDRDKMWDILWGYGISKPVYISTYPNNSDAKLEQVHQIFGKLVTTPVMSTPYFNRHSATVEIEEV